ncbi:hypothetical protein PROVRUST_05217 [Providencia rustigianii DSM 4541]|uniref:Uncharacterized protein n=1 Tax=Providencia rustigianii DSM 4541 TaxID=500637 RepID=D1NY91_9GAMM|nr:hypothetical protein PROVRUST_05217 [Providencia rustigianii DSM 4541]
MRIASRIETKNYAKASVRGLFCFWFTKKYSKISQVFTSH